jgi:hypothetical protein
VRGGGFKLGIETLGNKDLVAKNLTEPLLKLIADAIR